MTRLLALLILFTLPLSGCGTAPDNPLVREREIRISHTCLNDGGAAARQACAEQLDLFWLAAASGRSHLVPKQQLVCYRYNGSANDVRRCTWQYRQAFERVGIVFDAKLRQKLNSLPKQTVYQNGY